MTATLCPLPRASRDWAPSQICRW